ncbi:preprotein translocase subunit SecG [Hyphococcus lacteus]|uniref:Protein-export membrane protein SecG n=1 Tax=Hyphococcus lacteus TaxID=3143536 RepID=A0ABV3Z5A2_9PROT
MTAVILTIHALIVLALIGVVLLQRSDGGALGLGGGGGGGGFMTGRGAANALTRTTSILAALFFATSLILAIRAGGGESADDIADDLTGTPGVEAVQENPDGDIRAEDLLNSLEIDADETTDAEALIESMGGEVPQAGEQTPPAADTAPAGDSENAPADADAEPETETESPN